MARFKKTKIERGCLLFSFKNVFVIAVCVYMYVMIRVRVQVVCVTARNFRRQLSGLSSCLPLYCSWGSCCLCCGIYLRLPGLQLLTDSLTSASHLTAGVQGYRLTLSAGITDAH